MKKVFVAISSGIDSTVALKILAKEYNVTAVFMRLYAIADERRAKEIADFFNVPFLVFDFRKEFKEKIINRFIKDLKAGNTPNPCVLCNRDIKFNLFYKEAKKRGADLIATGHYVKKKGEFLYKAKDEKKDQSYFLWGLTKEQVKNSLFPLGDFRKEDIRKQVKIKTGKESQEVCFDFSELLESKKGKILDENNNVLGKHQGVWFYTIGQRKGIELPQGPFFVFKKDVKNNILYVTKNKELLLKKEVKFKKTNWFVLKEFPFQASAKIRYRAKEALCTVYKNKAIFKEGQSAVTSGQSIVFYKNKKLIGGGIIYE
ncbi:MAG: tRNA 2-thiouridine(34) synthase MnmA [Candidatus Pacebacteria bacterium]|nr:tRNA 2-thiouridine(34) synthase MnmA [Candidatus Paceibacterota bacterium]MDD2796517.1 tRNA 2-thiouridine(34) synthase MnmA [Candidatus Paceibacterota bacterium]MDD3047948.1 tRNA 2-thiouridine(34) synthase MnmA [Candidatus Paceibacterota bacterium]MDD3510103.1 tRNA 2-thiouridine(34) synthase MnmA [Candidatus Paceibacterota bacterium]MDD3918478.1 tRNA 2-thiouridine(34) synthase MnmA [Candidatus Paceibacterota bacterium]